MNKERTRGFERVKEDFRKNEKPAILPARGSIASAGYDFVTPVDIHIAPQSTSELIFTDIKAYMQSDEVLNLHVRSSMGIKKGLTLANTTGIIDSDYYSNKDNDGNIGFKLRNLSDKEIYIEAGTRVIQGIFSKYLVADSDTASGTRDGGFGSTGSK